MRRWLLAALLPLCLESGARAETTAITADGVLGPAYLTNARSHTLSHLFKPILRLDASAEVLRRLEVGGTLLGIPTASEHYRVLGVLGRARYAVLRTATFALGPSAALGLGYDADILHRDLAADARIAPYWLLGVDARWEGSLAARQRRGQGQETGRRIMTCLRRDDSRPSGPASAGSGSASLHRCRPTRRARQPGGRW